MTGKELTAFLNSFPAWDPASVVSGERELNLDALRELLKRIGDPQNNCRYIHVAGTNGKGSFSAFISSVLRAAGHRTGLFSSPNLDHFTEEYRIDGKEADLEELAQAGSVVRDASETMREETGLYPSRFEAECAIGFLYFAQNRCSLVVLEAGLGGRTDATNVISVPELAVITSISMDHMEILGDTLEKIAAEKAGIIKEHGTVLLYPQEEMAGKAVLFAAEEKHADLHIAQMPERGSLRLLPGEEGCETEAPDVPVREASPLFPSETAFDLPECGFMDLRIRLAGEYQIYNASLAVQAALLLREKGYAISDQAIRDGLYQAQWPGRFELLLADPVFIADGAHNVDGIRALASSLRLYFPEKKISFITGMLRDKAYDTMIQQILPLAGKIYTIAPSSKRALSAVELADYIRLAVHPCEIEVTACGSVEQAIASALDAAEPDEVICCFGSLYHMGRVRRFFRGGKR